MKSVCINIIWVFSIVFVIEINATEQTLKWLTALTYLQYTRIISRYT